ncbi:MAG TPA: hypothetical protein VIU11_21065 [Nakamurella sp.]
MRRHVWWIAVLLVVTACTGGESSSAEASLSTTGTPWSGQTGAVDTGTVRATTPSSVAGGTGTVESATTPEQSTAQSMSSYSGDVSTLAGGAALSEVAFDDLLADPQRYVGQTVTVTGTVHFVSVCPPPGQGGSRCILNGYFAAQGRDHLTAGETDKAIPLAEGGALVSCPEAVAVNGGCGGWGTARSYRVVAEVTNQVLGGRETQYVQLNVVGRVPL